MDMLDTIILGAVDEGCDDALSVLESIGECENVEFEYIWNRLNSLYNSGYLLKMRKLGVDDSQPWLTTTFMLTGKGSGALAFDTKGEDGNTAYLNNAGNEDGECENEDDFKEENN